MEFDERRYRPLSTVDLFDEAFDLYKRNFVLFLTIIAVVLAPVTICKTVYFAQTMPTPAFLLPPYRFPSMPVLVDIVEQYLRISTMVWLVALLPTALSALALTSAVSARYRDFETDLLQAYTKAFKCLFSGAISYLFFGILSSLGLIVVLLGQLDPDTEDTMLGLGIVVTVLTYVPVMTRFPLFLGAVVNEHLGPFRAMGRSLKLTSRDAFRIFGIIICLSLIMLTITLAISSMTGFLTGTIYQSSEFVIPWLANHKDFANDASEALTTMLMSPFVLIVATLLYFDQRVRKEGFDMEILAASLGYPQIGKDIKFGFAPQPVLRSNKKKMANKR